RVNSYYENVLDMQFEHSRLPDANLIGKNCDVDQLSLLLQLMLGIAINCEDKQKYIQNITALDLDVQHNLMEAIQQLMSSEKLPSENVTCNSTHAQDSLFDSLNFESSQKDLKDQLNKVLETLKQA